MTLKKDVLVCGSMAGVVLLLAAFSTTRGREVEVEKGPPIEAPNYNRDLLYLYIDTLNPRKPLDPLESDFIMAQARRKVMAWQRQGRLSTPIDGFRAASILRTSTDPEELALSHDLSLNAFARGIKPAKRLILESEDRLLLSKGRDQRYGTQTNWEGEPLDSYAYPSSSISPSLAERLGVRNPRPARGPG